MSYSFFPLQNVTLIVGPTVTSPSVGMRSWIPTLKCRNSSTPTLGIQFFKDVSFGINSAAFKDLFCGKSESKSHSDIK